MLRIGIDVGGTHTDAVLVDGDDVVSVRKVHTSADVLQGVLDALSHLLHDHPNIESAVQAVMLGTTQFTNAVVERRELSEVAAIRIGLPSGRGLPPLVGWPVDIASAVGPHPYQLTGGVLYDGWPLADTDEREVDRLITELKAKRFDAVAISSVFSPMNAQAERELGQRIQQHMPDCHITLSHEFGQLGILERENAAILNVALRGFAARVVDAFSQAVRERGLRCPFYISQNDGTLMDAAFARQFPALTFASGPTNSLRGAAKLSGLDKAIVIDIGGTTSDIGILDAGFPRESNAVIEVGGVRTNFRMPDIIAVGLGGGSIVHASGTQIGPQSVGHRLTELALVFGGKQLTATDIAVASGHAVVGRPSLVADVPTSTLKQAQACMLTCIEQNIEKIKPSADSLPIVLVGGGSILFPNAQLNGAEVHRPQHADVANAIGAAIAQMGGVSEQLIDYEQTPREQALGQGSQEAKRRAIGAGADADSLRIAAIEETSLSYMPGAMTRLRVKAVGDIGVSSVNQPSRP